MLQSLCLCMQHFEIEKTKCMPNKFTLYICSMVGIGLFVVVVVVDVVSAVARWYVYLPALLSQVLDGFDQLLTLVAMSLMSFY